MRINSPIRCFLLSCGLVWGVGTEAWAQLAFTSRVLADGLKEPHGVAVHPATGDIYVAEKATGRILVLKNGKMESALPAGWTVSTNLPRWGMTTQIPKEKWMTATLEKPGPISVSTNGTLFVAEQVPNGRILEFLPNAQGAWDTARGIPVPWLDQEFQWRDLQVDRQGRFYVVGADEVGSDFMKFGSCLVREADGNWWVIDFGPFASFSTFALSDKQDVMILGDRAKGTLSWWEVNRHIMMGGSPEATKRAELSSLAVYPDGAFVLGQQTEPGKAEILRMDPFTGQQTPMASDLKSIGDIEIDRANGRYLVTDPVGGRLMEYTPNPPVKFNEAAMRQIVRSVEGMMGMPTEAPAFLNTFFEKLQDATKGMMSDEDTTHAVDFNLSDIAGKMPVVAGRVRATVEVEGLEEDPIEQIEFFLLFPSKVVMTETAVSPSLSFFSARRKSGKMEQTRPVFQGTVGVYRLSGTNVSKVASAQGGMHIPVVVCGLNQADNGVYVNLSFLGAGIYGDYYLTLFQSPGEQKAKLVVKSNSTDSGTITYEASFMEEATIKGMEGAKITKEQLSNLLISGFNNNPGANKSVGWLKLGQFPASGLVAFGDAGETQLTGAASGLKEIVEKRRLEGSLEAASDIEALKPDELAPVVAQPPLETAPAEGATP